MIRRLLTVCFCAFYWLKVGDFYTCRLSPSSVADPDLDPVLFWPLDPVLFWPLDPVLFWPLDPVLFWPLDPGSRSGMEKSQIHDQSGINIPELFFESVVSIFWVVNHRSGIRAGVLVNHPGSATLSPTVANLIWIRRSWIWFLVIFLMTRIRVCTWNVLIWFSLGSLVLELQLRLV
jgi:hypothetical protein